MSIDGISRNGNFIYVCLILCSIFTLILPGCSGMKTGTDTPASTTKKTKEPTSDWPTWYQRGTFGTADSVRFYGQAMAAASDSADGMHKAEEYARRHLEQVIGDSLEQLRRRLGEQKNTPFSDASFLIHLRNAVDGMGTRAVIENKVSVEKESRWIGFAQVYIKRSRVKEWIRQQLSEYPDFIESW